MKKAILLFLILSAFLTLYSDKVKGLYINRFKASSDLFYSIADEMHEHHFNAAVIDVKYDRGENAFNLSGDFPEINSFRPIPDLKDKLHYLKERGIKPIARIVCFKDNFFGITNNYRYTARYPDSTLFKDISGSLWVSPYSDYVREYIIKTAVRAAQYGFEEIQFDYVRFPSDFPEEAEYRWLRYPEKYTDQMSAIEDFLKEAYYELKPLGVDVSADLFGYTVWLDSIQIIGQNLERASKYTDIIYPMVYPSHFADKFLFKDTYENRTYELIFYSGVNGQQRTDIFNADIILFIQDFDWKKSGMGKDYINNQIKAAMNSSALGFVLWNSSSNYNYFKLENPYDLSEEEEKETVNDTLIP